MPNTKRGTLSSGNSSRYVLPPNHDTEDINLKDDYHYLKNLSGDSNTNISGLAKNYLFKEDKIRNTFGPHTKNSRPGTASGNSNNRSKPTRLFNQTLSSISKVHSPRSKNSHLKHNTPTQNHTNHKNRRRAVSGKSRRYQLDDSCDVDSTFGSHNHPTSVRHIYGNHQVKSQNSRLESKSKKKNDSVHSRSISNEIQEIDVLAKEVLNDSPLKSEPNDFRDHNTPTNINSINRGRRESVSAIGFVGRNSSFISTPITSYSDPLPCSPAAVNQLYRHLNSLNSLHFQTMELQSELKETLQEIHSNYEDLTSEEQREYKKILEEYSVSAGDSNETLIQQNSDSFRKSSISDIDNTVDKNQQNEHNRSFISDGSGELHPQNSMGNMSSIEKPGVSEEKQPNLTANALESRYGPPPPLNLNKTMTSDTTTVSESIKQLSQSKDDVMVKYRMEKMMRKLEKERIARMKLEKKVEALVSNLPNLKKIQVSTPSSTKGKDGFPGDFGSESEQHEDNKNQNRNKVPPKIMIPEKERTPANRISPNEKTPKDSQSKNNHDTTASNKKNSKDDVVQLNHNHNELPQLDNSYLKNEQNHENNGQVISNNNLGSKNIENNSKEEGRESNDKKRKLLSRARHNRTAEVEKMLSEGLSPDSRDAHGNTILIVAAQNGHKEVMETAIHYGADLNATNRKGQTALHFCYTFGYTELGEYLLSQGADDKIRNNKGLTCYEGL
eukprot:gb/GECH01014180.1/.p1 GENE.gb/GECH01014180.1/~~gb/GECH01014180.1/.p1  ORF type:complete len:725 (+),score=163.05 gb/GECH01014180.1/:1-2175(+)